MMRAFVFVLLFLVLNVPFLPAQVNTTVAIRSGGSEPQRTAVAQTLQKLLRAINLKKEPENALFAPNGKAAFKELASKAPFVCLEAELNLNLIELSGGDVEIRQIPVHVQTGGATSKEELVVQLTPGGLIRSLRFAIEKEHLLSVFGTSDDLVDLERRQIILQFIERYRTAYNRKDITYIETTFSDNAIIIVGQVLKEQKPDQISLDNSTISKDNIRFIRYSKNEYIQRLKSVTFKQNSYIQITFSEVSVVRHPKLQQVYGVNLRQRWNASTYSDEGYLFLMIDFTNEQEPLIHVRSWQPEPFSDGSTVNLFDFPIIE
jgi:hypothetical protein